MRGTELASCLGYPVGHPVDGPRAGRAVVRRLAASRPASWMLARTLRRVDAGVALLTGRRASGTGLLAGLPVIMLTTTGARSGRAREVPLVPVVTPEMFSVLGTNFGGRHTPAWVHNLLAEPRATVAYRGRAVAVLAVELAGAERTEVLRAAAAVYPGFGRYELRASHRRLHVFALEAEPRHQEP